MPDLPVMPEYPRSAYIDAPALIRNRTTAAQRGWYAGWPDNCPPSSERPRIDIIRPSDGYVVTRISVDKRLGVLYSLWLAMIQKVGPELRGAAEPSDNGVKQGGVGSFSCRAIKGSNPPKPSNHSSGTALDVWTRSNPMRVDRSGVTFVSTIHPKAVELAAAADLYWGGWYFDANGNYVDSMHVEYMRRPEDVADSLAKLKAKYAEIKGTPAPDPQPEDPDVTPAQVKLLQAKLNEMGASPPLLVDGIFGPLTESALAALAAAPPPDPALVTPEQVKLLQAKLNELGAAPPLLVDGIYGPLTQAALSNAAAGLQREFAEAKRKADVDAATIAAQDTLIKAKNTKFSEGLAL